LHFIFYPTNTPVPNAVSAFHIVSVHEEVPLTLNQSFLLSSPEK
jgi:hypothetical protein